MSTGRSLLSLVAADHYIYAIGGLMKQEKIDPEPTALVERYDWNTGKWTAMRRLNIARSAMAAAILHNGIFVMGGATKWNSHETASVERFDFETEEWTMVRRIKLN